LGNADLLCIGARQPDNIPAYDVLAAAAAAAARLPQRQEEDGVLLG
jgi:hypothetical protein